MSENFNIINNENDYSISEVFHVLRKHRMKIFISFLLFSIASIFYTYRISPVYEASSVIMISEESNAASVFGMGLVNGRNYIDNEIEILSSRTTSSLAVKKLLDSKYKDDMFLFDTKNNDKIFLKNILSFDFFKKMPTEKLTDIELVDKFSNKLRKSIKVTNKRNTDAILLSVTSNDPNEASLLTNTLVGVYMKRDLEWVTGEMSHLKVFLSDQLSKKEIQLNEIEERLKEFQETEKIFGLDENSTLLLENLTNFETQYNNILAEIDIATEKEKYINQQLTNDEKQLTKRVSNTINDRLFALKYEMTALESEMISTISQYGEEHSAVSILGVRLGKLKSTIEHETRMLILKGISVADPILYRQGLMDSIISIRSLKSNLISRATSYKKLVDDYELKLSSLPKKMLQFTRLERIRSIQAETYSFMSQKLEEARIGEASKLGKIRVVDSAIPNYDPIKPNKVVNILFGSFLGLFIGFIIAMGVEFFDNTIKSVEQIERRGLSILSIIPAIGAIAGRNSSKKKYAKKNANVEKLQRRLITHEDPKSPVSEAYRGLRTSLMYTVNKEKCNIILVSSAGPGEGKTTTIANLAITYANLGKKTLLVDSDLRKPVLHNVFKIDKSPGLTSFLSGISEVKDIISKSDIENLDIIPSGVIPPNPSELLDSELMQKFIDTVKHQYDVVLFDSPPLIAVTDSYIILKYITQFILVVRSGVSERGGLDRVLKTLNQSNLPLTGIVLNAMTEENSYGAGYYYNYYQYYYEEGEK